MHDPRYIKVETDVYIDTKGGPPPPWRAAVAKVIVYGIGAFVLSNLVIMLYPSGYPQQKGRRASCELNLKSLAQSIALYEQDYDGRFPLAVAHNPRQPIHPWAPGTAATPPSTTAMQKAAGTTYGWADAALVYGYYIGHQRGNYHCPSNPNPQVYDPPARGYTDYWLNSRLSGKTIQQCRRPDHTVLLGEGNDGNDNTDATYNKADLPSAWRADRNSPAYRHLDSANYAFADGHVEWLTPDRITSKTGGYTCSLQ